MKTKATKRRSSYKLEPIKLATDADADDAWAYEDGRGIEVYSVHSAYGPIGRFRWPQLIASVRRHQAIQHAKKKVARR